MEEKRDSIADVAYCKDCDVFYLTTSKISSPQHSTHQIFSFEEISKLAESINLGEDEIEKSIGNLKRRLEGFQKRRSTSEKGSEEDEAEILLLQVICGDPGKSINEIKILKMTNRLDGSHLSSHVKDFISFYGADELQIIKKVNDLPLVDIGYGIKASDLIEFNTITTKGYGIVGSISNTGIFSSYSDSEGVLEFVSLLDNEKKVRFGGLKDRCEAAFIDNKCYLLSHENVIKVAPINLIFEKKSMSVFKDAPNGEKVWNWCDVSLAGYTRRLVYSIGLMKGYYIHEYDVDTATVTVYPTKALGFGSLTGILIDGVKGIFSYDDDVMVLNDDGTGKTEYESTSSNVVAAILPSSSDPNNLHKSLIVDHEGIYAYNGHVKMVLEKPFLFEKYISIVRLVRDIFIVYDCSTSKWSIVRLIVE